MVIVLKIRCYKLYPLSVLKHHIVSFVFVVFWFLSI